MPATPTSTLAPPMATHNSVTRTPTPTQTTTEILTAVQTTVPELVATETTSIPEQPTPLQVQLGLPAGTVIALHQTGGFAGVDNLWIFYDDGLVQTPTGQEITGAPEEVTAQVAALQAASFFEMVQPKPEPICCDHFSYTLYARDGDQENAISVSGGDPDLAPELLEIIRALQISAEEADTA